MSESVSASAKAECRSRIRKQRAENRATHDRLASGFTQQILSLCTPKISTVAAYLPMPGEPPIRPALSEMHRRGIEILVPVVEKKRQLSWVVWSPDMNHPLSSYGIEEPEGTRFGADRFLSADLHLIPALAYDRQGNRLGQGGGFYDTLLAQADTTSSAYVGVIFETDFQDAVPVDSHDAQLMHVVTEKRLYRFG